MERINKPAKGEIASLYVLKALCAFGVVALHAPSGVVTPYIQLIAQLAVPTFFMITGYFLYTEDKEKLISRLSGSIKKVLIVMLITHLVYTLVGWQDIPSVTDYVIWAKWILLGQGFPSGHLWYLTALVETLILFYIVARLGYGRYIGYFASFWLLRFVFADYRMLIFGSPDSFLSANALFIGIPCVATGWAVRKHQAKLLAKDCWLALALATVGLSLVLKGLSLYSMRNLSSLLWSFTPPTIEMFDTATTILLPVFRLVMVVSIFLFALQHSDWGKGGKLEYIGKNLSGNIYYWHALAITLVFLSVSYQVFDNFGALLATIISTIFAYLVVWVQRKAGVNWLP